MLRFLFFATAFVIASFAADMPAEAAPPAVTPIFNWAGFYAGLNAGLALNKTEFDNTGDIDQPLQGIYPFSKTNAAFAGGIQAGYNYQFNNSVLGVEGSFDYVSLDKGIDISVLPGTGSATLDVKQNWLGSVGLRLGSVFDRILVYAGGGIAFTNYDISHRDLYFIAPYTADYGSHTEVGWTVGAGAEYAVSDHWVAGLDYKFYGFEKKTYDSGYLSGTGAPAGPGLDHYTIKMNDNVLTARVGYKF